MYLDGKLLRRMEVKFGAEEEDEELRRLEVKVPVTAGRHQMLVSFLRDDSKNESPTVGLRLVGDCEAQAARGGLGGGGRSIRCEGTGRHGRAGGAF